MASTYREEIKSYLDLIPNNKTEASEVYNSTSEQLQHRCSSDPDQVRQEVETLRTVWSLSKVFYILMESTILNFPRTLTVA